MAASALLPLLPSSSAWRGGQCTLQQHRQPPGAFRLRAPRRAHLHAARCAAPQTEPGRPGTEQTREAEVTRDALVPGEVPDAGGSPSGTARKQQRRGAESTDWIASAVTRRFGIGAGLAWVGFLAFGVISEQLKTRREVFLEEALTRDVDAPTETTLPNGISYSDLRVGGGASPFPGDLVIVSLTGKAKGSEGPFVDTTGPGSRDIVFTFGRKPYRGGVTEGLVLAMQDMKAGGRRSVRVPAELGFGSEGAVFRRETDGASVVVPPDSELEYTLELKRVSISPS